MRRPEKTEVLYNKEPLLFFVHREYLGAVDTTSHVETMPTGLASYFLV